MNVVGWWILDGLSKCDYASLRGIVGGVLKNFVCSFYVFVLFIVHCSLFCFVLGLFDLRFCFLEVGTQAGAQGW